MCILSHSVPWAEARQLKKMLFLEAEHSMRQLQGPVLAVIFSESFSPIGYLGHLRVAQQFNLFPLVLINEQYVQSTAR